MRYFWFVFLFFIVAYLVPLAGRPLVTPDEFRYAEIPREMIADGDYVTPRLLNVRYFEKPVLGYWLTVGCFKMFGDNAFSIRLPAALGAGLTALLIWLLVDQALRDRKLAALAAIFYLSCGLVYGISTFAVLDSQTTAFITGILVTSYLAAVEPCFNRRKALLLVLCGVFTALAFLTKGFIAFAVPGLAMLGFLIWERRWKEFLILPWIPLVVALALIAPWAIAVHRAEPDYWRYFVVIEHWQRFTADAPGQHPEPFWFLFPFLVGGVFPAALLLIPSFSMGRTAAGKLLQQPLYRFCLSAVVLPFLFFSASSGKLATYILPCFPPLAVLAAALIAAYFKSGGHNRGFHRMVTIWGGLLVIAAVGFGIVLFLPFMKRVAYGWCFPAAVAMAVVGLAYGASLLLSRRADWRTRFHLFFAGMALLLAVGGWAIPDGLLGDKAPERAMRELADRLGFDPKSVKFFTTSSTMHAVAWVFGREDVQMLNSRGELAYGDTHAKAEGKPGVMIDRTELDRMLTSPSHPAVVVIGRDRRSFYHPPVGTKYREELLNEIRAIYIPEKGKQGGVQ